MKYIKAVEVPNGTHLTKRFHIETRAKSGPDGWAVPLGTQLGTVKWHPGWRCFAFFPLPETLFEPNCMRDLADFCEAETTKRRAERKLEREAERA